MQLVFNTFVTCGFLLLVAFFAGCETGFVSLDVASLRQRAKISGKVSEKQLLDIVRAPERFLALTLIGTNMSLVVATSFFSQVLNEFQPFTVSAATFALSVFIFLFCELVPKMAFASQPLAQSLRFLFLLRFFDRLLAIPVLIVTRITRGIMDFLKLGGEKKKRSLSREELLILLSCGASSGVLRDRPHRMARGIIGLKERNICEIMRPRMAMVTLDVSATLAQARKVFSETGYSRIPVYEGNVDHVIGFLYFKDIFLMGAETKPLRELLSGVIVAPEMSSAFDLFHQMRVQSFQAAIVADEFGSTTGMVTLEDLIEEVVGEIEDEFDESPAEIKFNSDGTITARSEVNLATFCVQTSAVFCEAEGINTLNGLILERLGRIPQPGECLLIDGFRIEVLQADARKTILVKLDMTNASERSSTN